MLHLHRARRADALVPALAGVLATPPDDPFARDVVAVPTRGVERWLAQRLSHHLGAAEGEAGVCALVDFDSPSRLVGSVLAGALGVADPRDDPWHPDRLAWPLLACVDSAAGQAWCAAVSRHLGAADASPDGEVRRGRRLALARAVAGLYASYAANRPHMLVGWAAGHDDDGTGRAVPPDLAWQPELWRLLRARLDSPSPAERLAVALRQLRDDPHAVPLPQRLSVFGPTRLPEDQRQVLTALALRRDVHLWLPHPSPALWDRVAGIEADARRGALDEADGAGRQPAGDGRTALRRAENPSPARHPLLASMARDVVELQRRLARPDRPGSPAPTDSHHLLPEPPATLLGALQRSLAADLAPVTAAEGRHVLAPSDHSVQVHACHGTVRQVEVLREVLTGLMADDPTLQPRDVIVMCPDVETMAPLVAAVFGAAPDAGAHPGRSLGVSIADAAPSRSNGVLSVLARLLELAGSRVSASEVLDLVSMPPVRRRFGLSDDDLARLGDWVVAAGIRWGEGRRRRERFGLADVGQGTWQAGLDRILLGVAMAEEDQRFLGSALPLDDVASTDIDLAGRLAELVSRLTAVLRSLEGPQPLRAWTDALLGALDHLVQTAPEDAWQTTRARDLLADVAVTGDAAATLRLPDIRALLAHRLAGRPTRAGFRTGAVTVCSLEPMRAVPHRVVCLLGLDDGRFPRSGVADGDDLLLRDPLLGEHDRRGEDRQIFLDAVTAAQDHLVVLYAGADERTGARRPPSVPVAELLDALDACAALSDGAPASGKVHVHHPLLDVAESNFTLGTSGSSGRHRPFSFDAAALDAARAGRERRSPPPFLAAPLPPLPEGDIDLEDLAGTLEHPVRAFVRRRLGLALPRELELPDDHLPLSLDPLTEWGLGTRLLRMLLAGVPWEQARDAEWRRGEVPPRRLGEPVLESVRERAQAVARATRDAVPEAGRTAVDITVTLSDGRTLRGTVPDVAGTTVVRSEYSKLGPKHRVRAWVHLLALAANEAGSANPAGVTAGADLWRAVTVGRSSRPVRVAASVATTTAPEAEQARALLADLVDLHLAAVREPLPLPLAAACAYARSRAAGDAPGQALDDAGRAWRNAFDGDKDDYHVLAWGAGASLTVLGGEPRPGDAPGWADEPTRFGALARRLWDPVLACEMVADA